MGNNKAKLKHDPFPNYDKNYKGVYYSVRNLIKTQDADDESHISEEFKMTEEDEKKEAYLQRIGNLYNLIFTRSMEQLYDINQVLDKRKQKVLKSQSITSKFKEVSTPRPDLYKKRKPQEDKKLSENEIMKVREEIIASRQIYNQKGIKTEESAELEVILKDPSFNDKGIREMEYLSLGASKVLV